MYVHAHVLTDKVVYTAVTAGCPSAFRLKYKAGGLARMQVNSPLTNMGNFGPSPENKAFRANTLLGKARELMTKFTLIMCRLWIWIRVHVYSSITVRQTLCYVMIFYRSNGECMSACA